MSRSCIHDRLIIIVISLIDDAPWIVIVDGGKGRWTGASSCSMMTFIFGVSYIPSKIIISQYLGPWSEAFSHLVLSSVDQEGYQVDFYPIQSPCLQLVKAVWRFHQACWNKPIITMWTDYDERMRWMWSTLPLIMIVEFTLNSLW